MSKKEKGFSKEIKKEIHDHPISPEELLREKLGDEKYVFLEKMGYNDEMSGFIGERELTPLERSAYVNGILRAVEEKEDNEETEE
ncbi:hypothetical protein HYV70_04690 [Candidatus Uhrbacteria bacterium]|nr:hypothetical protein [Candidatus Uhrbacteria bacterium]